MSDAVVEVIQREVVVVEERVLDEIDVTEEVVEVLDQVGGPGPPGEPGGQGPQGLQGPPGIPGEGATYVHNQTIPAAVWTINHGLGRFPSVTVVDSAGTVVIGEYDYESDDQIVASFSGAFAGKAYLN